MYLASLIFISAMYNIGLLFSCLANRSAISLILGLFFWVVCVVVVPNASVYTATRIRPLEPKEKTDSQVMLLKSELKKQWWDIMRAATKGWSLSTSQSDAEGAFGNGYIRKFNTDCFEWQQELHPAMEPLKIKYADRIWEVESGYLKTIWKQRRLADNLSRISPIFSYENATSVLAGTDLSSFQYFVSRTKAYRSQIIEYIRSRTDNFRSSSYWTPFSKEYASDYGEGKREAPDIADHPRLNLEDLPPCTYRLGLAESVQRAIPDLALLVFANVLFFALSFVAFMKGDVR